MIKNAYKIHNWTAKNQVLLLWMFGIGSAIGIGADLVMVLILKMQSISLDCWDATTEHPTLIAAGVLAGVAIAYLTRSSKISVGWAMLLTGHLFTHW